MSENFAKQFGFEGVKATIKEKNFEENRKVEEAEKQRLAAEAEKLKVARANHVEVLEGDSVATLRNADALTPVLESYKSALRDAKSPIGNALVDSATGENRGTERHSELMGQLEEVFEQISTTQATLKRLSDPVGRVAAALKQGESPAQEDLDVINGFHEMSPDEQKALDNKTLHDLMKQTKQELDGVSFGQNTFINKVMYKNGTKEVTRTKTHKTYSRDINYEVKETVPNYSYREETHKTATGKVEIAGYNFSILEQLRNDLGKTQELFGELLGNAQAATKEQQTQR